MALEGTFSNYHKLCFGIFFDYILGGFNQVMQTLSGYQVANKKHKMFAVSAYNILDFSAVLGGLEPLDVHAVWNYPYLCFLNPIQLNQLLSRVSADSDYQGCRVGCILLGFCEAPHENVRELHSERRRHTFRRLDMLICQNAVNSLYERFIHFPFPEKLQEFVAADSVCLINVGFYCVNHSGEGPVENPVVQRIEPVSGEAGNNSYPIINYSGFFEAPFCSTVNRCVNVLHQPFGNFNYSPFNAPKVKVRRLRVKDGYLQLPVH